MTGRWITPLDVEGAVVQTDAAWVIVSLASQELALRVGAPPQSLGSVELAPSGTAEVLDD